MSPVDYRSLTRHATDIPLKLLKIPGRSSLDWRENRQFFVRKAQDEIGLATLSAARTYGYEHARQTSHNSRRHRTRLSARRGNARARRRLWSEARRHAPVS